MNNINREVEFVSIPFISGEKETRTYEAYYPIVMFDGEYDHKIGMTCGTSIRLKALKKISDAVEAAKAACLSMPNAIGYMVNGVKND